MILPHHHEPATEFVNWAPELHRRLSRREVLCRSPPFEDDHFYPGGRLEFDDVSVSRSPPTEYGREYAIKFLSKADLDEEELVAQLTRYVPHLILAHFKFSEKTSRQRFISQFLRAPTL